MSILLGDINHYKMDSFNWKGKLGTKMDSVLDSVDCEINLVAGGHIRIQFLGFRTTSSAGGLPVRRVRRGCRVPCLPGRRGGHNTVAGWSCSGVCRSLAVPAVWPRYRRGSPVLVPHCWWRWSWRTRHMWPLSSVLWEPASSGFARCCGQLSSGTAQGFRFWLASFLGR